MIDHTISHVEVAPANRRRFVSALERLSVSLGWLAKASSWGEERAARASWKATHRVERTMVLETYRVSAAYHLSDGAYCNGLLEMNPALVSILEPVSIDEEAYLALSQATTLDEAYDHLPHPMQFVLVFNGMVPPREPEPEPEVVVPDDLSEMDEPEEGNYDHIRIDLNNPGVAQLAAAYHRDGTLCQAVLWPDGADHPIDIDEHCFEDLDLLTQVIAAETPGEAMLIATVGEG